MNNDEVWMRLAIEEAKKAEENGEVPVGAIIVKNNKIIAKAHNSPISKNDPTAHAEVLALRKAGKYLQNYRLPGITLYVTLEPCTMCFGAMIHSRIGKLVFGCKDTKSGIFNSLENFTYSTNFGHKISVNGGVLDKDCQYILQSFFKVRR